MLKVSQNDENHCATFCGKPVETVETVENAQARKEWILAELRMRYARQGAKAPFKTKEYYSLVTTIEKKLDNRYNAYNAM